MGKNKKKPANEPKSQNSNHNTKKESLGPNTDR